MLRARLKARMSFVSVVTGMLLVAGMVWAGISLAGDAPVLADNANKGADHVRWDIIHLIGGHVSEGGVAFANTVNHVNPQVTLQIKLTGDGTFVAPASGGTSSAVTGGGTWETFAGATSTGSGTYTVTKLVSWEFESLQTIPQANIDDIGVPNERANGNAVLLIEYSDGSHGILGIGCHGPGAANRIHEGVIATKGFATYWDAQGPAGGVDKNRTLFHVRGKP